MTSLKRLRSSSIESDVQRDVDTNVVVVTKRPWNVIVWNDPVTPMTVVVVVFKRIFGYSNNKCTHLMLTVHHEGRAVVWSGERERAESYCVKLQVAGLQSTVEQDAQCRASSSFDDVTAVSKCALTTRDALSFEKPSPTL